jgi:ABC-type sulfate/molybdate transport systems ATPase subunit
MLNVTIDSFAYAEIEILKNISFSIQRGDHLVLLGESGCGKSTLLHLVYGLLHLEHGSIHWDKKQLMGPTYNLVPGEPFIKIVAQEFNVMPFTTVSENIATYLSRQDSDGDAARVAALLKVVDLEHVSDTLVKHLSGGQKQRVALAKALANEPELLLLDEPFSHIDSFRKNKLRRELFAYLKQKNIACITATHDSEEALAYADKIMLLKDGAVELAGSPEYIYLHVSTNYQAGFFGEINELPASLFKETNSSESLILFPHQLEVTQTKTKLRVEVKKSYFKGSFYLIEANWKGRNVFFTKEIALKEGEIVQLQLI